MQTNIFKIILVLVLLTGLLSCAGMSVTPSKTTLTYGETDQDGDGINGSYGSDNFTITQTFTWGN
jgi:hypothetical protein